MSVRAALAGIALLACRSPRERFEPPSVEANDIAPSPVPGSPTASPRAPAGANMIDTLRELARLFGSATLTPDDITGRLGPPIGPPPPAGIATKLASTDPRFAQIGIASDAGTGRIDMLLLTFADGSRPTVGELRAAFGAGKDVSPSAIGAPRRLRFPAADSGTPFTVALLATLTEGAHGVDGDPVVSVSLVREERLE